MKAGDYATYKGRQVLVIRIIEDPLHTGSIVIQDGNITRRVAPWELK